MLPQDLILRQQNRNAVYRPDGAPYPGAEKDPVKSLERRWNYSLDAVFQWEDQGGIQHNG